MKCFRKTPICFVLLCSLAAACGAAHNTVAQTADDNPADQTRNDAEFAGDDEPWGNLEEASSTKETEESNGTGATDEWELDNWRPGEPIRNVAADLTGYLTKLASHHNNLFDLYQRIKELGNETEAENNEQLIRFSADCKAIGQKGVVEGQSLLTSLHAFINSQTRSGLRAEIGLAKNNVRSFAVIVRDYQQLVGFEPDQETTSLKDLLLQEARSFALERLKEKIAERFDSEGLRQVLKQKSWQEAQNAAITALRDKANERLDSVTQETLGLGFHDLKSLRTALRIRVDTVVQRHVEEILIRLSGKGLIISIISRPIITWLADEFWANVQEGLHETFRQKGNHEFRVTRSLATLENARQSLFALPSDARLRHVDATLNKAVWTVNATRYLVADLNGAIRKHAGSVFSAEEMDTLLKKIPTTEVRSRLQQGEPSPEFLEDMLLDDLSASTRQTLRKKLSDPTRFALLEELSYLLLLNAGIEDVRRASVITMRGRFLVQNRERLLKLREEEELLRQLVAYLKKLVDQVEAPKDVEESGTATQLYLRWYEVPGQDGIPVAVPADKPRKGLRNRRPGDLRILSLWTELFYVDTDLVTKHREYWRSSDRTDVADQPVDRLPYPSDSKPHHGRYAKTYVAKIIANGQTFYLQRASGLTEWGGTEDRTWTCGRILGLTEGTHEAKVSIITADGISAGTTIRLVVDAPDPRKQQAVQGHEKRLSDFRRRQAADKAAGRTTSLTNLPGYLIGYARALLDAGQGTPDQIVSILEEAFIVSNQVRNHDLEEVEKRRRDPGPIHRSYFRTLSDIVPICEFLGGSQAYPLALKVTDAAETTLRQHGDLISKSGTEYAYELDCERLIGLYPRLAKLAISSSSDANAAIEHLEDWMKLRREIGDEIDEQYEKNQRLRWPQDVQFR